MSAGHTDWHDGDDGKAVCAIEDDSSRKILSYGEFDSQDTENSKIVSDGGRILGDLSHERAGTGSW